MPKRAVRTGEVAVSRPPEQAIALFTPEGERAWAPGWAPRYPDPHTDDATAPGTVWQTSRAEGEVTWIVALREDARFRYAFFLPELVAGTVTVSCRESAEGGSVATVTYDVTSLGARGESFLAELTAGFDEMMATWESLVAAVPEGAPGDVRRPA